MQFSVFLISTFAASMVAGCAFGPTNGNAHGCRNGQCVYQLGGTFGECVYNCDVGVSNMDSLGNAPRCISLSMNASSFL